MTEMSFRERMRLNLVSAMKTAGLNQVQLADKLGIKKGTVNNWVRGHNSPDVEMVPKICDALGISIQALFAPADNAASSQANKDPFSLDSNVEIVHMKKYRALDERGRRIVDIILDEEYRYSLDNNT